MTNFIPGDAINVTTSGIAQTLIRQRGGDWVSLLHRKHGWDDEVFRMIERGELPGHALEPLTDNAKAVLNSAQHHEHAFTLRSDCTLKVTTKHRHDTPLGEVYLHADDADDHTVVPLSPTEAREFAQHLNSAADRAERYPSRSEGQWSEGEWSEGDVARIVAEKYGHGFAIGAIVTIGFDADGDMTGTANNDTWCIRTDEIREV